MKKIILALSLAAVMILSGCTFAEPEASQMKTTEATPEPTVVKTDEAAPESLGEAPQDVAEGMALLESVIGRVQKNIDTGTFEGFTEDSTFDDVVASAGEISYVANTFAIDFLSFPANVSYCYMPDKSRLSFSIRPDERIDFEGRLSNVFSHLDDSFGSHTEIEQATYSDCHIYIWEADEYQVQVTSNTDYDKLDGVLASISLPYSDEDFSSFAIQGVFYDLFGVEFNEDYEDEMHAALINKSKLATCEFSYVEDDVSITYTFIKNEQADNFIIGRYAFRFDITDAHSALYFIEASLDRLRQIYGEPNSLLCHSFDEDIVKTINEMKQQGWDKFRINAFWEKGISLGIIYYGDEEELTIEFGRENF